MAILEANIEKPMPEIMEPIHIQISYHFCSLEMEIFLSVYIISRNKEGNRQLTCDHFKQTTACMT